MSPASEIPVPVADINRRLAYKWSRETIEAFCEGTHDFSPDGQGIHYSTMFHPSRTEYAPVCTAVLCLRANGFLDFVPNDRGWVSIREYSPKHMDTPVRYEREPGCLCVFNRGDASSCPVHSPRQARAVVWEGGVR